MSTINAQNYGDGTGSVPASAVLEGTAKAWVRGTDAAAIDDSYNVSSGTDHGTGDFSYALTDSFATVDYALCAECRSPNARVTTENDNRTAAGTIALTIRVLSNSNLTNAPHSMIAAGDLA